MPGGQEMIGRLFKRSLKPAVTWVETFLYGIAFRANIEVERPTVPLRVEDALQRNPLLAKGARYFSQNDEDGIVLEILRRLKLERGTFLELGVGDGLENNTLILLSLGWSGAWLEGGELAFTPGERLAFVQGWIDADNVVAMAEGALARVGARLASVSVASIDLDGNDLHIATRLLDGGLRPDLLIVEYNAKFPPPVEFVMPYKADKVWRGGDYYGASLTSWAKLLSVYGYRLVTCNLNGINAFFVKEEHAAQFEDVPSEVEQVFMESSNLRVPWSLHRTMPETARYFTL
jgi:hypothetical protein